MTLAAPNRLLTELERLYLVESAPEARLVDSAGRVRAMVLEVAQPANWSALSEVWHGVQVELELPAPGIAVSGRDGFQLWFSVQRPTPAATARAFVEALRARFLAHVPAQRVRLWPTPAEPARHAELVPAAQAESGNWSAFVASDLAALFSETPWLDMAPGEDGQATLLRTLQSMKLEAFDAALAGMRATAPDVQAPAAAGASAASQSPGDDSRRFLLRVMNDESVALALRIEAAKALLTRQ